MAVSSIGVDIHQARVPLIHAAATHDRQGQSRVYSSFGEHYDDKTSHINEN